MSRTKHLTRACALPLATGAVVLAAGPSAAHVSISPEEGAADSYTVLTASVPHGCDGSPTTEVAIKLPEQINAVTPTRNPLWNVRTVMQQLDEPVTDGYGNEITERVEQVVYTAKEPLPEGYRDTFELSLQLPDAAGETLVFPVVQTCEEGETAWVETASEGDTGQLEAPAPTVEIVAAESEDAAAVEPISAETSDDSGSTARVTSIAALAAGLLALAVALVALIASRRRP